MRFWIFIYSLGLSSLLWVALTATSLLGDEPRSDSIAQYIAALDDVDFQSRENAVSKLVEQGEAAVPALLKALKNGSAETQWRACTAVEAIILQADRAAGIRILKELTNNGSLEGTAFDAKLASLQANWALTRSQRALKQLRSEGVEVISSGFAGDVVLAINRVDARRNVEVQIGLAQAMVGEFPLIDESEIAPIPQDNAEMREPEAIGQIEVTRILEKPEEGLVEIGDLFFEPDRGAGDPKVDAVPAVFIEEEQPPVVVDTPNHPFYTVILNENWRPTSDSYELLAELINITTVQVNGISCDRELFSLLEKLPSLRSVYLNRASFDLSEIKRFRSKKAHVFVQAEGPGMLGVRNLDLSSNLVEQVISGSGAAEAGIQAQDRILKIDGETIKTWDDLRFIVASKKVGSKLSIVVEREGASKSFEVELKPRDAVEAAMAAQR